MKNALSKMLGVLLFVVGVAAATPVAVELPEFAQVPFRDWQEAIASSGILVNSMNYPYGSDVGRQFMPLTAESIKIAVGGSRYDTIALNGKWAFPFITTTDAATGLQIKVYDDVYTGAAGGLTWFSCGDTFAQGFPVAVSKLITYVPTAADSTNAALIIVGYPMGDFKPAAK